MFSEAFVVLMVQVVITSLLKIVGICRVVSEGRGKDVSKEGDVPLAFWKVMVRSAVGSVSAKVVSEVSAVAPSNTKGEAP
jgi:hypothetical protein